MATMKFYNVTAVPTTSSAEGTYYVKDANNYVQEYLVTGGLVKYIGGYPMQDKGTDVEKPMSQKAVTDELALKADQTELDKLASKDELTQVRSDLSAVSLLATNNSGGVITKGKLVSISGSTGENPLFLLATNTDNSIVNRTLGMTYDNVNPNAIGKIIHSGIIENINTSAYTTGTELWLGVNGEFTNVRPTLPTAQIYIGMVIRSSTTEGSIFIDLRYESKLTSLADVKAETYTDGDVPVFNGTNQRFEKQNIVSEVGISDYDEYDPSITYETGAIRTYQGKLYKCISNIISPEQFNISNWVETSINEISNEYRAFISQEGINANGLIYTIKDSNNKILFGIKEDGSYEGIIPLTNIFDSKQWIYLLTDINKKILIGLQEDGEVVGFLAKYIQDYVADNIPDVTTLQNDIKTLQDRPVHPLYNKEFFTLGDSLCDGSNWQNMLVSLTGAVFDSAINNGNLSYGGTTTGILADNCGFARAKKIIELKETKSINYLFIENINDLAYHNNIGSISDKPFFLTNKILGYNELFNSYADAANYATNNLPTILAGINSESRKVGTALLFNYMSSSGSGYKITITGTPTKATTVYVVQGTTKRGFEVTTDMTIQDIINEITKYSYGAGWNDIDNGDGSVTIFYYTTTTTVISFDAADSGIVYTIEKAAGTGQYALYFKSFDISAWETTSNWDTSMTLYSIYKGLLEYLIFNLTSTKIFWFIPPRYSLALDGSDSFVKSDGTYDIDTYKSTSNFTMYEELKTCQKAVCDYYKIPYLDVDNECGITLYNASQFYNANNVHPKATGYQRWAETITRLI